MAIKRPIKLLLYAQPGVGKSVFASQLPKPFFICTDGNYEWLLDFGAKEEDHININSFAEFEKLVQNDFAGYDTIVVDLIEDIYKWNEYEFCKKQKVDHLSDAGGYGKGWDITRNRLFVACSKLLALPKNIVFLSHESSYSEKDRKGNEKTKYQPSNLMSEKFMIMLEGRLRYVLRAKFEDEVMEDGKVVTHRVLSLVPKSNEYGIIRGVDVNLMPEDIELDAPTFLQVIGYIGNDTKEEKKAVEIAKASTDEAQAEPVQVTATAVAPTTVTSKLDKLDKIKSKLASKHAAEPAESSEVAEPAKQAAEPEPATEPEPVKEQAPAPAPVQEVVPEPVATPVVEEPVPVAKDNANETKTIVIEEKVETVNAAPQKAESHDDKIAKIKAKLAAKAMHK